MSDTYNTEYVPPVPEEYPGYQPTPEEIPVPGLNSGTSSNTPTGTAASHTIRFKNEKGAWVDIPYAVINVYDTYVAHCKEKGIIPVSQDDYYVTLGNLGILVQQLAGSSDSIQALAAALSSGALPPSMGGTGLSLSTDAYIYTLTTVKPESWGTDNVSYANYYKLVDGAYIALTEWEDWEVGKFYIRRNSDYPVSTLEDYLKNTLGLIKSSDVDYKLSLLNQDLSNTKLSVDRMIVSKDAPNKSVGKDGDFYFHYES